MTTLSPAPGSSPIAAPPPVAYVDPPDSDDSLPVGETKVAPLEASVTEPARTREPSQPKKKASQALSFLLENSLFLIGGTVGALVLANTDHHLYHQLVHGVVKVGDLAQSQGVAATEAAAHTGLTLHFLVNDILMCFFFAMAAKEIWEALLPGGALSSLRKATTPLFATVGGIAGPALLYVAGTQLFSRPDLGRGWAVPTATDIAFSYLVARLIFGSKHPAIPFLLLLAIADDAVGLLILAIFYPQGQMSLLTLGACVGGAVTFNLLLRRASVQNFWAYLVVAGPLSWYGFHEGGVHPALALVPIIPTLPHADHDEGLFQELQEDEDHRPTDALNAFEHWWKNPVELILMLFGFCNAGVLLGNVGLATGLVSVALLLGKPLGIGIFTWLAVKILRLEMPAGMNMKDVLVLGTMAGIGFTVALFVSDVAFGGGAGNQAVLDAAKMGALLSFLAVGLSFALARILRVRKQT